jgi:hypothetical protein
MTAPICWIYGPSSEARLLLDSHRGRCFDPFSVLHTQTTTHRLFNHKIAYSLSYCYLHNINIRPATKNPLKIFEYLRKVRVGTWRQNVKLLVKRKVNPSLLKANLEVVTSVKYQGVDISNDSSWDEHINRSTKIKSKPNPWFLTQKMQWNIYKRVMRYDFKNYFIYNT